MTNYDKEIASIEKARKSYEKRQEEKHRSISSIKRFLNTLVSNTDLVVVDKRSKENQDVK